MNLEPKSKKMKLCKVCDAEIAKSAHVCPNCGAKNQMGVCAKFCLCCLALVIESLKIFVIVNLVCSDKKRCKKICDKLRKAWPF